MDDATLHRTANRDVVVQSLEGSSALAVIGGEYTVFFDEPKEFRGRGIAPNPFGMLLAALGA